MRLEVSDVPELNKKFNLKNLYLALKALGFIQFLVVAIPLLLLYLSITNFATARNISQITAHPVRSQAIILEKLRGSSGGAKCSGICVTLGQPDTDSFKYKFKATNGLDYVVTSSVGDFNIYNNASAGDSVNIIYDSQNPKKSYLASNIPSVRNSKLIFYGCGAGGLLTSYFAFSYFRRSGNFKRPKWF